jgi:hypothetical protein|tara:strand:- start:20 stop:193 length:174 start_codon:yes stop_codon:yes gene_type:complete
MVTLLSKFSVAGALLLLGRGVLAALKLAGWVALKSVKFFFLFLLLVATGRVVRGPVD